MLSNADTNSHAVSRTGLDAVALKPATIDVERGADLPVDTLAIDYEGREHLPAMDVLRQLAADKDVYLTTPVRADGFDPLGDDGMLEGLPSSLDRVLVAGHSAYLTEAEANKAIAPRIGAALESAPNAWVGTEGIERVALATGGTQYELLSRTTEKDIKGLRAAGFTGDVAVYAPTVLTDDEDGVLDAVGEYVARRRPVAHALPDGAETDRNASGRAREVLSTAARDFALVGDVETVRDRVSRLKSVGVTTVVGYPARGIDDFLR